jgi:sugar phosphate isomerase/epimerase
LNEHAKKEDVMDLGFVTAILPDLGFEDVLAFAKAENFKCVEVMCWPVGKAERKFAGVTHIDVTDFSEGQAEDTLALCEKYGISISGLGYYPNPLDPDPEVSQVASEHLKRVIKASAMLGVNRVNSFIGRDWTKSVDDNWPKFLEVWRPLIGFAEEHGVKVGIENCPMLFTRDEWPGGKNLGTTPAIWRRMFSDIPSDCFGLNYDPSHLALQMMDPAKPLIEFKDKLFHLHAKDVKIYPEKLNQVGIFAYPLEWHQPRIPGFGEIDWAQYMGKVMETGYDGPMCIEVEDGTFGETLEGRKQALRVARNVLQPYFG